MSIRKRGYVSRLILAWVFASLPYFWLLAYWGWETRRTGAPLFFLNPFGPVMYVFRTFGSQEQYQCAINGNAFWQDKYVTGNASIFKTADGTSDFSLDLRDPETGDTTEKQVQSIFSGFIRRTLVVGDHVLFIGSGDAYVFAHGELKLEPEFMPLWLANPDTLFILDDHVAEITPKQPATPTTRGFELYTFESGKWCWTSNVVLPDHSRETRLNFASSGPGAIKCVNRGDHPHFFSRRNGYYYYRDGLDRQTLPDAQIFANDPTPPPGDDSDGLAGWSLIRTATKDDQEDQFLGMFVAGQPAIAVIEGIDSTEPCVRFYRFDGTSWPEFAVQKLPLGSLTFHANTVRDAERAYLAVSTSMGFTHVYAIEDSGVRKTRFSDDLNHWRTMFRPFVVHATIQGLAYALMIFIFNLLTVVVFGLGVWWAMSRHTVSQYEFGLENVELASIGWRGLARLIDLMLIAAATGVYIWQVAKSLDWLTLLECMNMQIDHPEVARFKQLSMIIPIVPVGIALLMMIAQARWGITPGKWLCQLRAVRLTLRPCGLAASLARETMLLLDCGSFLVWTPGILSIALTQHRQRLGDLLGDTVVINTRSKKTTVGDAAG